MHGSVMADRHIVFNDRGAHLVGDVHACSVLYVDAVAHVDIGHIASDDGVEPDRAFITHYYFAYNGGVLTEITVFSPLGSQSFD